MSYSSNNFLGVKVFDLTYTPSITTGASADQELKPPAGECYRLTKIWFSVPKPAGAGSGTHELVLTTDGSTGLEDNAGLFICKGAFSSAIATGYGALIGNDTESPSGTDEQQRVINGISRQWATYDTPILVQYNNDTDVTQANDLIIFLTVEVYKNAF